jgi:CRP-like cAMP-binding protein
MGIDVEKNSVVPTGLQGVPWFDGCTEAELAEVAERCERLAIEEGEVILREGRLGRELFVILSGRAAVTHAGHVVNTLGPGEHFGELAAIDSAPRSATVTATSDLEALVIGPREFDAIMSIPSVRNALLRGMSRRLREADDKLAEYSDRAEDGPGSTGAASTG